MGYDEWLVAPQLQMLEETDRFLDWCEQYEYDPDDPDTEDAYLDFVSGLWQEPEEYDDDGPDYEDYLDSLEL